MSNPQNGYIFKFFVFSKQPPDWQQTYKSNGETEMRKWVGYDRHEILSHMVNADNPKEAFEMLTTPIHSEALSILYDNIMRKKWSLMGVHHIKSPFEVVRADFCSLRLYLQHKAMEKPFPIICVGYEMMTNYELVQPFIEAYKPQLVDDHGIPFVKPTEGL